MPSTFHLPTRRPLHELESDPMRRWRGRLGRPFAPRAQQFDRLAAHADEIEANPRERIAARRERARARHRS